MCFEITGFSQKPTALIQKDEGFRYKWMWEFGHYRCWNRFFGRCFLDILYKRKILRLKPQYDYTFSVILSVAKNLFEENHFVGLKPNLQFHRSDPETSGFCVVRSGSADTKEQKVRRTTTKCSEQRLFVKQNPKQFRVTGNCLSCWTRFSILWFVNNCKYFQTRFFGLFKTSEWRRIINPAST